MWFLGKNGAFRHGKRLKKTPDRTGRETKDKRNGGRGERMERGQGMGGDGADRTRPGKPRGSEVDGTLLLGLLDLLDLLGRHVSRKGGTAGEDQAV